MARRQNNEMLTNTFIYIIGSDYLVQQILKKYLRDQCLVNTSWIKL